MRENDLVLEVSYRCRCKNNRGWRCNNATKKRGTQCEACGVARKAREQRQWAQRMVRDSRSKDKKPKRKVPVENRMLSDSRYEDKRRGEVVCGADYIDVPYLKQLKKKQQTRCYWCGIEMDSVNRKQKCGMTVDRLDDGAHLKNHCVLACFSCNAKSYRQLWNPFPLRLTEVLKPPVCARNYLHAVTYEEFNQYIRPNQWVSRLTVNRWARLQEELLRKQRPA